MSKAFEKYTELRDYLSDGLDTCKVTPEQEEAILDEMDVLWDQLTEEDRKLLDGLDGVGCRTSIDANPYEPLPPHAAKVLDAAHARIAALEAQLREREEHVNRLESALAERDQSIRNLRTTVEITAPACDKLLARAESAEAQLAAAREENERLRNEECNPRSCLRALGRESLAREIGGVCCALEQQTARAESAEAALATSREKAKDAEDAYYMECQLREAQLAAAREENERLASALCESNTAGSKLALRAYDAGRVELAAEERGARAFAEMLLNEGIMLDYGSNVGREGPTSALARWLAARKE